MSAPALTDNSGGTGGTSGHFGRSYSKTPAAEGLSTGNKASTVSMALAAAGPYGMAAAAAIQIWSGYQQASDARHQAELQRTINEANAKFMEYDAWETEKFGYTQAARYQSVVSDVIGKQKVGFAAQGIDISTGTASEIIKESKLTGLLNALDIQSKARGEALGLKMNASNLRLGSDLTDSQASATARSHQISGYLGAMQTGISALK